MSTATYINTGMPYIATSKQAFVMKYMSKIKALIEASDYSRNIDLDRRELKFYKELSASGISRFQLDRNESRHIFQYLRKDEHIKAAIHGHVPGVGSALIVATDSRVLYLHETPSYSNFEEFSYDAVNGVSINRTPGVLSSISIFTKYNTYQLDYVNSRSAEKFVSYVESRIYEHPNVNSIRYARRRAHA